MKKIAACKHVHKDIYEADELNNKREDKQGGILIHNYRSPVKGLLNWCVLDNK